MTSSTQPRRTPKPIVTLLWLIGLAWLSLMLWILWLWVRFDIATSFQCVEHLFKAQCKVLKQFPQLVTLFPSYNLLDLSLTSILHHRVISLTNTLQAVEAAWTLICAVSQVILLKLGVLITALPLFLLAVTAGLIDGLNQRAIRTANLGRESTYIFHQWH